MTRITHGIAFVVLAAPLSAFAGGVYAPFTDETAARGISYTTIFSGSLTWGFGVCFADLNNDGAPDLVTVGGAGGVVGIWENDGTGHFISRAATSGIFSSTAYSNVTAADIDGDGDLDLIFGLWEINNRVFRNDGDFAFTNISVGSGLNQPGRSSSIAWGDVNGDGAIDAYSGIWEVAGTRNNALNLNDGFGVFQDVAPALGVDDPSAMTYAVTLFDFNRDGRPDLFVGNDRGPALGCVSPNRLWRNDGGVFTDITALAGAGQCVDSMSATVGDFDRNGWPDLYVTNTAISGGNVLLLNQGDGTFIESATITGTRSDRWGWGAQFLDFDNDGFEDLFVTNEGFEDQLYRHGGSWPAVDIAPEVGLNDPGPSFTVAYADVDGDGDLDLVVSKQFGALRLWINNEGQTRNWLRIIPLNGVGLAMTGSEAEVTAGGVTRYAQLVHNSGYKSQNEHVLHFGLGDLTVAEEVRVTWPGLGTKVYTDVAANRVLRLSFCLADLNNDGVLDLMDIQLFVGGFIGVDPVSDLNGDGLFDLADLSLFVGSFTAGCP